MNSTYNIDDEFMVGNDLLVAPILKTRHCSSFRVSPERNVVRLLDKQDVFGRPTDLDRCATRDSPDVLFVRVPSFPPGRT
jgi:hypothetical protein